ncbi:unnamed protein product [Ectocarpus sp. 12 AP-2014]
MEVSTTEGSDPDYIANEGQSCFRCKTHLYSALEAVAAQAGVESRCSSGVAVGDGEPSASALEDGGADGAGGIVEGGRRVVLFNGTNKDDKRDTTRVGLKAAADFQVASPIDMLTKAEVGAPQAHRELCRW